MSKTVIVLSSDDWEMLYVDGQLKAEGHTLNEGRDRVEYMCEVADEHGFDLTSIQLGYLTSESQSMIEEDGSAPMLMTELSFRLRN